MKEQHQLDEVNHKILKIFDKINIKYWMIAHFQKNLVEFPFSLFCEDFEGQATKPDKTKGTSNKLTGV